MCHQSKFVCLLIASLLLSASTDKADNQSRSRVPLNPAIVEKALLEPASPRKFDPKVWQESLETRQSMLLDFFRSEWRKKSREQIHQLFGQPKWTDERWNQKHDIYDLGEFKGENLVLQLSYNHNLLESICIAQHSEFGYLYLTVGEWQWRNPEQKDAAKKFNQFFYLVGAPKEHLCQFIGHPGQENGVWKCGNIQLEFTADTSKVKRFRFLADKQGIFKMTTDWEDKDLRAVPGSYSTAFDFLSLTDQVDALLIRPWMKFNGTEWTGIARRAFMIHDLVNTHPLIGKRRDEIQELLGEPYYSENKTKLGVQTARTSYFQERAVSEQPFNKFDWYQLCGTGCVSPAEPSSFLEIIYKTDVHSDDIAVGYRLVQTDKYRDGAKEFFGRNFIGREGFTQALPATK